MKLQILLLPLLSCTVCFTDAFNKNLGSETSQEIEGIPAHTSGDLLVNGFHQESYEEINVHGLNGVKPKFPTRASLNFPRTKTRSLRVGGRELLSDRDASTGSRTTKLGDNLFANVCHHSRRTNTFKTIRINKLRARWYLKTHPNDRQGNCDETIVNVLDIIETFDSPEAALNGLDPLELKILVQSVQSNVSPDMTHLITEETVVRSLFPNPNTILHLPGFNVTILNNTGTDMRRALTMHEGKEGRDLQFAAVCDNIRWFDTLKDGCCELGATVIASALGVVISFLLLPAAAATPATQAILAAERAGPAIEQMFAAIELAFTSGRVTTSNALSLAQLGYEVFSGLSSFLGLDFVIKAFFNSLTPIAAFTIGAQLIVSMIALFATGGSAYYANLGLVAIAAATLGEDLVKFFIIGECINVDEDRTPVACPFVDVQRREQTQDMCISSHEFYNYNNITDSLSCDKIPKPCQRGFSCDKKDGICKLDDELVPCVAVIDEDDDFTGDQEQAWADFRTRYPVRPFCLLVPSDGNNLKIPSNFEADSISIKHLNMKRDNGDINSAEDWFTLCGLNYYTTSNVGWVALFIDDSGSLNEYEVAASRDLFYDNLNASGFEVRKVVNSEENWILPFMTTLSQLPQCISSTGQAGECRDVNDCINDGKTPIPSNTSDPEPNCVSLPTNFECCI